MAQVARFEEQCGRCNGDIHPGDHVEYDSSEGGWIHADLGICEDNQEWDSWDSDEAEDEDY